MANITMSQVTELVDPKLRGVAKRVYDSFRLGCIKAIIHHAEPTNYPITADPSFAEQIFLSRFREFKPAKQQVAVARAMAFVKASEAERSRVYGDLAKVNLRLATPIEEQVKALSFPEALKFPLSHLNSLTKLHGQIVSISPGLIPQQTTNKLELRIHQVRCVDETNPEWWGDDEIYLAGTSVDETGDTKKIAQFKVGDFDDGDVKNYSPPKQFTWFNLLEGGTEPTAWPKSYFVTLVLAEKDMGDLADFVDKLWNAVKAKVIEALSVAVEKKIGPDAGPIIGAAVGAAVSWIVGKLIEWIKKWLGDDVFSPATVSISIPSLNARWAGGKTDSPEGIISWRGYGGHYTLTYDWRLFA